MNLCEIHKLKSENPAQFEGLVQKHVHGWKTIFGMATDSFGLYSSDANADLESNRAACKWSDFRTVKFISNVLELWAKRKAQEDLIFPSEAGFKYYEIGDYSVAALAAVGGEL